MCVPGVRMFVRPTPFQLLIVVVKLRHVCATKPQQIRTDRTSRGRFKNKRIGKLALSLSPLFLSLTHSLTCMHARTHAHITMLRKPEPEVTAPGEAGMEGRQASELTGLNPTERVTLVSQSVRQVK